MNGKSINFSFHYQHMLCRLFIITLFFLVSFNGISQQQLISSSLVIRLDSISSGAGRASHFAELYLRTTIAADKYIQTLPSDDDQMMKKLELSFAEYFFRAIEATEAGHKIPPVWKNYFSDNDLSPLQLKLMGANAHINGDIWQALVNNFSLEELTALKPAYRNYNKWLSKVYDELFDSGIASDKRLRNLHSMTFGLDKVYGKMMLRKWRNRQMKLAIFSFEDEGKFTRLKKRVENKMERIDMMIIRRLR